MNQFQPILYLPEAYCFYTHQMPTPFTHPMSIPFILIKLQPLYINQIPNLFKLVKYKLLYTGTIMANGNPLLTQWQPLIHTMPTPSYVQNMVTYIFLPSFIQYLSPLLTSHRTSPP